MVGICLPKRFRFSEERGDDEHTERGRQLLRQEQVAQLPESINDNAYSYVICSHLSSEWHSKAPSQEAKQLGLPVGECLGLWGSAEAPGITSAAQERLAAKKLGRGATYQPRSLLPEPQSNTVR